MENALRMPSSSGLLEGFRSWITPEVVSKASSTFGESEAAVKKGLGALMPTVFGALASKAGDRTFMSQVFDMIRDPAADSSILNNITNLVGSGAATQKGMGLGNRFMSMLFGGNLNSIGDALSNLAGIKPSTAVSMVGIAGPLTLAYLGNTVRTERLDASGLSNKLLGERSSIMSLVPTALSSLAGFAGQVGDAAYRTAETAVRKGSAWRWLLPLLIGILLLWGLSSLVGRRATPPPASGVADTGASAAYISRSLPSGVSLQFLANGIEGKLLAFIEDPALPASKEAWFDFDRLLFETNAAVLKPESRDQLSNIAEILRAYPAVKVKVGGYTDSSGDPAANMQLSQGRANSVMQALVGLGVSADRLTAEGYGTEHPVASNTTEAGRAQNRRVALRVTEK